jgi:hypothetical protein
MKKPILAAMAAFLCLTMPVHAQEAAGTDQTGTDASGVESTGTRTMVGGESGTGVVGRGMDENNNFPESNQGDRADTSVSPSADVGSAGAPGTAVAPAASHGTHAGVGATTDTSGANGATSGE